MESSRSKKGSSQAACHCICWKCSNFNPSVRTQNCPDLYPLAIQGIVSGKKNIVLLPMENRHSHVYQLLLKINILKDILYLVERMIKGKVHCILLLCLLIIVFALSLCCIWEIKWYKYQTTKHIYSHEHEDLVQKGGQWLASKANSCRWWLLSLQLLPSPHQQLYQEAPRKQHFISLQFRDLLLFDFQSQHLGVKNKILVLICPASFWLD